MGIAGLVGNTLVGNMAETCVSKGAAFLAAEPTALHIWKTNTVQVPRRSITPVQNIWLSDIDENIKISKPF